MKMDNDSMFKDDNIPKWLKTIQLNSWEAELLISALVLYALFQIPNYLDWYSHTHFQRGSELIRIFRILEKGIQLLQIGYITHISVRGIWVASVGFSYVFPHGINSANLGFKGKFKKELEKNPSLVKNVLRLEELSSMIYGLSFTFFGLFIGLSSFLLFFILVFTFFAPYSPSSVTENPTFFGIFSLIYALTSLLVFIDFITSGLFRRKDWAIDWFYPIARFYRIITLSFLYRRSLLVLISNLKGWKARLVSLFIGLIIFGYMEILDEIKDSSKEAYVESAAHGEFNVANYENLQSSDNYFVASIQSDIVSQSYLKLFLKDVSVFGNMSDSPFDRDEVKWDQQHSDSCSYFLNKWLILEVDSIEYTKPNWVKSQHASTLAFGFHTYLDLDSLMRGAHRLTIQADTSMMSRHEKREWKKSIYADKPIANILFYIDK